MGIGAPIDDCGMSLIGMTRSFSSTEYICFLPLGYRENLRDLLYASHPGLSNMLFIPFFFRPLQTSHQSQNRQRKSHALNDRHPGGWNRSWIRLVEARELPE